MIVMKLLKMNDWLGKIFCFAVPAFSLYVGITGILPAPEQRGIFILLVLPALFLTKKSGIFSENSAKEIIFNLFLAGLSFYVSFFRLCVWVRLNTDPFCTAQEAFAGFLGIILVLEAVRRAAGWALVVIAGVGFLYCFFGPYVPSEILSHRGFSVSETVYIIWYSLEGVFGVPTGVVVDIVVLFILFGAFLQAAGATRGFIEISEALTGRMTGGPAKVAVISSSLFGTISGSAVANVTVTGTVTIPMMKKSGFPPAFAGAVEAVSSSGGQLMPPVMGASAFLMADVCGIPYWSVCLAALIPAVLYYGSVFSRIHFYSLAHGLRGLDEKDIHNPLKTLKLYWHLLGPIIILIVLLALQYSPMLSVTATTIFLLAVMSVRKSSRINFPQLINTVIQAGKNTCGVAAICAAAGVLVGSLAVTGLALKSSQFILDIAGGSAFLALLFTMVVALILGVGMPTPAAYITLAIVCAPALIKIGFSLIGSHLFSLYFAILGCITPPVALAAYAAAPIANESPFKVGITASWIGIVTFLIPFSFIYIPELLLQGSPLNIILYVAPALASCITFGAGLQGFLFTRTTIFERYTLILASIFLLWPAHILSITGVGLMGLGIYLNRLRYRNSAVQITAEA
jgi:TRAP transporter 4TM/12TM fusion protein